MPSMEPEARPGREHEGGTHGGSEHGDRKVDGGAHKVKSTAIASTTVARTTIDGARRRQGHTCASDAGCPPPHPLGPTVPPTEKVLGRTRACQSAHPWNRFVCSCRITNPMRECFQPSDTYSYVASSVSRNLVPPSRIVQGSFSLEEHRIMHDAQPVTLTKNYRSGFLRLEGHLTKVGPDSLTVATSLPYASSKTHSLLNHRPQG